MKLNKTKIAAFDVDPQKGFTPLCPHELPVSEGDTIVEELNKQASLASIRIGSKDAHNPKAVWVATKEKPQFSSVGLPDSDIRWNSHCNVGTWGFELLPGLPEPINYDYFIWKGIENDVHPYGACYHDLRETKSTGVIEWLKVKGIEVVIVGGLATDYCVKNTVLQLKKAGFNVILNLGACRGVAEVTTQKAILEMEDMGIAVCKSAEEVEDYLLKTS